MSGYPGSSSTSKPQKYQYQSQNSSQQYQGQGNQYYSGSQGQGYSGSTQYQPQQQYTDLQSNDSSIQYQQSGTGNYQGQVYTQGSQTPAQTQAYQNHTFQPQNQIIHTQNNQGYQYNRQQDTTWQAPPQNYFAQHQLSSCTGRKKSLLVGINYKGTSSALAGCINDVQNMKSYLSVERGWPSDSNSMVILSDDQSNQLFVPTRQNIINALIWLISSNNPGDSLFFHFSGHGGQQKDVDGDESDGYDETICPLDHQQAGVIVDDELNDILVKRLQFGVRLTAVFDCCHSGSVLDLPFTYFADGRLKTSSKVRKLGSAAKEAANSYFRGNTLGVFAAAKMGFEAITRKEKSIAEREAEKGNSQSDVIMFSGCKDRQTSADAHLGGEATGAMSYALIKALKSNPYCSYGQLLTNVREILQSGFQQVPQLSSGRYMDMNQQFIT